MGVDVKFEEYGKPHKFNFEFVEQQLTERAKRQKITISNFYMIGDNPKSDIAGANGNGWVSILVRTGVFDPQAATSKDGNDIEHPATHVVENFQEAIDLIYRLENLN